MFPPLVAVAGGDCPRPAEYWLDVLETEPDADSATRAPPVRGTAAVCTTTEGFGVVGAGRDRCDAFRDWLPSRWPRECARLRCA